MSIELAPWTVDFLVKIWSADLQSMQSFQVGDAVLSEATGRFFAELQVSLLHLMDTFEATIVACVRF